MTNRRSPSKHTSASQWKRSRPRSEILKAIGGAGGVVLLTALLIFVMKPGDSPSTTVPSSPVTTPAQQAGDSSTTQPATGVSTTPPTAAPTQTTQP